MKQKNPYFYTNILAWGLVLFLIGNYVFPAPINVSSTEQTKTGNLIIEGVLRLGQFATAPSGTEGALYYDTGENKIKVYSDSAWSELGGGWDGILPNYTTAQRNDLSPTEGQMIYNTDNLRVEWFIPGGWTYSTGPRANGVLCGSDPDCISGHCIDDVCCGTVCAGNCDRCNVEGSLGICTDVDSDCTGNCDICSSGNCQADTALCTGNCDVCSKITDTEFNCAADNSFCSNNTSSCYCSGSGTVFNCQACNSCHQCSSYSCIAVANTDWGAGTYGCTAGATTDPNRCYNGSCINCGGWGNAGYCWYNGAFGEDADSICSTHGGVYKGTCDWVNDPSDCSTTLHFYPGTSCYKAWYWGPGYTPGGNYIMWHEDGGNSCGYEDDGLHRQAACER